MRRKLLWVFGLSLVAASLSVGVLTVGRMVTSVQDAAFLFAWLAVVFALGFSLLIGDRTPHLSQLASIVGANARPTIFSASLAFKSVATIAFFVFGLTGHWWWLGGLVVVAVLIGPFLRCPVCGALTTERWIDGDGRGLRATYFRIPFATPKTCARCELDFQKHWFSGPELPELITKWNSRHVH